MKLMCINNLSRELDYIPPITPGEIYESIAGWTWNKTYRIINDDGFESDEMIENFITLEEWREQQLNKIL